MSEQSDIDPVLFPESPGIWQWMWEYVLARVIRSQLPTKQWFIPRPEFKRMCTLPGNDFEKPKIRELCNINVYTIPCKIYFKVLEFSLFTILF